MSRYRYVEDSTDWLWSDDVPIWGWHLPLTKPKKIVIDVIVIKWVEEWTTNSPNYKFEPVLQGLLEIFASQHTNVLPVQRVIAAVLSAHTSRRFIPKSIGELKTNWELVWVGTSIHPILKCTYINYIKLHNIIISYLRTFCSFTLKHTKIFLSQHHCHTLHQAARTLETMAGKKRWCQTDRPMDTYGVFFKCLLNLPTCRVFAIHVTFPLSP